ncbi:hypothetical protein [Thiomicrospira microaerophila]|uniref:hypothetical protein n=1 Tax=Thiomicrospira microaerophila TaxID=406020 RepID=UPI0005CA15F6|nr:hypothetical protein [Thiomicrospira microaerophila]
MRFFVALAGLFLTLGLVGCDSKLEGDVWPLVEDCDLHQQTCRSQQADARASLTLSPQPIPIAKPIQVNVLLEQLEAEKLELDISGINMYMGYNRVTLKPDTDNPDRYQGQTMLAFCTNEVMHWQLTLLVHQADGQVSQIPFKLETRNR